MFTVVLLVVAFTLFAIAFYARRQYLNGTEPLRGGAPGGWYVQCSDCGADTTVPFDNVRMRTEEAVICRGCRKTIYPKRIYFNLKEQ